MGEQEGGDSNECRGVSLAARMCEVIAVELVAGGWVGRKVSLLGGLHGRAGSSKWSAALSPPPAYRRQGSGIVWL